MSESITTVHFSESTMREARAEVARFQEILGLPYAPSPAEVIMHLEKLTKALETERRAHDNTRHELRAIRDLHQRAVEERDQAQKVIAAVQAEFAAQDREVAPGALAHAVGNLWSERKRTVAETASEDTIAHGWLDKLGAPRETNVLGSPMRLAGRLMSFYFATNALLNAAGIPKGVQEEWPRKHSLLERVRMLAESVGELRKAFEGLKSTTWPDEAVQKFQDEIATLREELRVTRDQRGVLRIENLELQDRIKALKDWNASCLRDRDAAMDQVTVAHEALNMTGLPGYIERECPPPRGLPVAERIRIRMAERDQIQQDLHEAIRLRDEAVNVRDRSFEYIDAQRAAEREECAKLVLEQARKESEGRLFGGIVATALECVANLIRNRVRYVIGWDLGTADGDLGTAAVFERTEDGTLHLLATCSGKFPAQAARDWLEGQQKANRLPPGRAELRRDAEFVQVADGQ